MFFSGISITRGERMPAIQEVINHSRVKNRFIFARARARTVERFS